MFNITPSFVSSCVIFGKYIACCNIHNKTMKNRPYSVHHKSYTNRTNQPNDNQLCAHKQSRSFRARTYDRSFNAKSSMKISYPNRKKITSYNTSEDQQHSHPKQLTNKIKPVFKFKKNPFDSAPKSTTNNQIKLFQRNNPSQFPQKRSQDGIISRPRIYHMYSRKFKAPEQCLDPSEEQQQYTKQLQCFIDLTAILSQILQALQRYPGTGSVSINSNSIIDKKSIKKQEIQSEKSGIQDYQNFDVQQIISSYRRFICSVGGSRRKLQFIDTILSNSKDVKLNKIIRNCRINEVLSICYLFLDISDNRLHENQSQLINFIGFCCNNLRLLARLYILLKKNKQYRQHDLQKQIQQFEIKSFGHVLHNLEHVMLRIQHNNEIISMVHKKIARNHTKFQKYIKRFMFISERNNHSSGLCSHYVFEYLSMYIHEEGNKLLGISPTLQIAPTPYLSPPTKQYTLVIQPLGVLKDTASTMNLRQYLIQFIQWAYKHCDIILWTWQMPSEIQKLQQLLQPYLFAKLYRYHCSIVKHMLYQQNSIFVKDIRRIGRNIQKTLIIDYDQRIFYPTPNNGFVTRYKNDKKDQGLLVICQILQEMITNSSTVQDTLACYRQELKSIRI